MDAEPCQSLGSAPYREVCSPSVVASGLSSEFVREIKTSLSIPPARDLAHNIAAEFELECPPTDPRPGRPLRCEACSGVYRGVVPILSGWGSPAAAAARSGLMGRIVVGGISFHWLLVNGAQTKPTSASLRNAGTSTARGSSVRS